MTSRLAKRGPICKTRYDYTHEPNYKIFVMNNRKNCELIFICKMVFYINHIVTQTLSFLPIFVLFRFSFVASSSQLHLIKLEFMELRYRLLALLVLAESKLKSWIIKYGRRESVELLLQNYIVSYLHLFSDTLK